MINVLHQELLGILPTSNLSNKRSLVNKLYPFEI